jgi:hypothetical protein
MSNTGNVPRQSGSKEGPHRFTGPTPQKGPKGVDGSRSDKQAETPLDKVVTTAPTIFFSAKHLQTSKRSG